MDLQLTDHVVVVTGAASGMGREEAERFAGEGARVVVADLDAEGARVVADGIAGTGGTAVAVRADVTSREDIARLVETAESELGPIDVLVNNAGVFDRYAASLETSRELWDRQLAINLTSVFEVSNAVLPGMIERGAGAIVNIASLAGAVAAKGGAGYTAAKHGVVGYTKHLASAYGPDGVRCNAVLPGTIETALTRDLLADIPTDPIPLRRFGGAGEVADLVVFLASGRSGFVNGACVAVDGGFSVQ